MIRLESKRKERVIYNPEPHHHYTLVQLLRENSLEKNWSVLLWRFQKNNWIMWKYSSFNYLIKGCPPKQYVAKVFAIQATSRNLLFHKKSQIMWRPIDPPIYKVRVSWHLWTIPIPRQALKKAGSEKQTWYLSKKLRDRIFRPKILHTKVRKLRLSLLKTKQRKCMNISYFSSFFLLKFN